MHLNTGCAIQFEEAEIEAGGRVGSRKVSESFEVSGVGLQNLQHWSLVGLACCGGW